MYRRVRWLVDLDKMEYRMKIGEETVGERSWMLERLDVGKIRSCMV